MITAVSRSRATASLRRRKISGEASFASSRAAETCSALFDLDDDRTTNPQDESVSRYLHQGNLLEGSMNLRMPSVSFNNRHSSDLSKLGSVRRWGLEQEKTIARHRTIEERLVPHTQTTRPFDLARGESAADAILRENLPVSNLLWSNINTASSIVQSAKPKSAIQALSGGRTLERLQDRSFSVHRLQFSTTSDDKPGKQKGKPPSHVLSRSKIPTPASSPPVQDNPLANLPAPKSLIRKGMDLVISLTKSLFTFLFKLPGNILFYTFNSSERKALINKIQETIKHEVNHYWVGTKLLWADIRTARDLMNKTLSGTSLTRRERRQLLRTVSDLFRLVPFSMFVIIPFMEFALPFALRIFPNLLPSTFQDSLKAEDNMKRELQSRIAMAQFFQETMEELAKEQKRKAKRRKEELMEAGVDLETDGKDTINEQEDSAASMLEFLEKARNGEMIPPDVIIRYANYFQDDLHIDNMPRMQLINMCKYMGIHPYGTDAFLRFQLRHKIRVLKEDDQRILWEGIDSLTKMELREACQERGMRSTGLSTDAYKDALQQWLDLSVNKNVPISLLIMSRTFFLREDMFQVKKSRTTGDDEVPDKSLTGLADAISGLDKEILNEVILQVATSEEKSSDPTIRKLKLEVVTQQNELIREEQAAREAAAKKKESEKEKEALSIDDGKEDQVDSAEVTATQQTGGESDVVKIEQQVEEKTTSSSKEDDKGMTPEDLDALRHLVSDDPVSKERAELEKIKAALMKSSEEGKEPETNATGVDPENADNMRKDSTDTVDSSAESLMASEAVDNFEVKPQATADTLIITQQETNQDEDEEEDPIVLRLKKRIESMLDKIEDRIEEVHVNIGDKLHFLDKDRDGIMSKEEVAEVLQQVFKKKLTPEEAMEMADEIVSFLRLVLFGVKKMSID